jgi:ornithine lipid hydroxylase
MPARNLGRLVILPALFALFYAILVSYGHAVDRWIPKWDTLAIICVMIILERAYSYKYAVSQRSVLARDIMSSLVNLYVTGAVAGMVFLPVLVFFPQVYWGRKLVFASSGQLGPVWLQVLVILLLVSLFRYWMHRFQHKIEFLWELHSYHHRVTDLKASNLLVSHPIDFALRNVLVYIVLGIIGFHPLAILITAPALLVSAAFSHCGGDVKGGFLNYVFVTPEVHRWHHSAEVPEGHRYSVNYGVEFAFWDILFGTFYLPEKDGQPEQPNRIGHPSGFADESNYLRLLLAPLGLYRPLSWFKRVLRPT